MLKVCVDRHRTEEKQRIWLANQPSTSPLALHPRPLGLTRLRNSSNDETMTYAGEPNLQAKTISDGGECQRSGHRMIFVIAATTEHRQRPCDSTEFSNGREIQGAMECHRVS